MAAETEERPDHRRRGVLVVLALVALVLVGVAAKAGYRLATRKQYTVSGAAMAPSLAAGDRIDCTKRVPGTLRRGSVVVGRANDQRRTVYVKRVVGLPGETIRSTPDGRTVVVDGEPLDEPYADPGTGPTPFTDVAVPEGHYFLLGDNRSASNDSRVHGPVPRGELVGVCSRVVSPAAHRGPIPGTP